MPSCKYLMPQQPHNTNGPQRVNSLAPGRSEYDSKNVISNLVLLFGIFRSAHDNALRWMPQDLTDDKSTLVQVMAWCRQATSRYLSQCWPRYLSPYGVSRPQWVNMTVSQWPNISWLTRVILPQIFPSHTEVYLIEIRLWHWGAWHILCFLEIFFPGIRLAREMVRCLEWSPSWPWLIKLVGTVKICPMASKIVID